MLLLLLLYETTTGKLCLSFYIKCVSWRKQLLQNDSLALDLIGAQFLLLLLAFLHSSQMYFHYLQLISETHLITVTV